jgi:membrane protease YdiL (CAAX protease family)
VTFRVRAALTLLVATVAFALALALRVSTDPWRTTGLAAAVAIGLSLWTLGPRLRPLVTISGRGALTAIALGVALVVATHVAFRLAVLVAPSLGTHVRALYASVAVDAHPLTLAVLTTLVVIGEELVWRGVAIALAGSRRTALPLSVAAYALPQLAGGVPLLLAAAVGLGAIFGVQRLHTGRLIDPIITHAIWSVSVFVLFPLV